MAKSVEINLDSGVSQPLENPDYMEQEWQFSADSLEAVEAWLLEHVHAFGFRLSDPHDRELTDTYFDTERWNVFRAGLKLRLRRRDDGKIKATLKSLPCDVEMQCRREVSQFISGLDLALLQASHGPVGERMRALAGPIPFRSLFQVYTQRRVYLLMKEGLIMGEISLDRSMISRAGQSDPDLKLFVELEGDKVAEREVAEFARTLRVHCHLRPGLTSKFETGLVINHLAPAAPMDPGPTHLEPGLGMGEFVWCTLRRHFLKFCQKEAGTRLGDDIEDLHQMRVSSRRLRTALRLFREYLPVRAESFSRTLRWAAMALGDVRDMDVKMEQIKHWGKEADGEDQDSFEKVLHILEQHRARKRKRMLVVLDSRRFQQFLTAFEDFLRQGPSSRPLLMKSAMEVLPDLQDNVHDKITKAGKRIRNHPSPENYHLLRIACKKQRYFLEFVMELCGPAIKPFRKRLVHLQDVLGDFNDAVVGIANIRQLVREQGRRMPPSALFTLGRMEERCRMESRRSLAKVPKLFRRFQDCPWKKLRKSFR